MRSARLTKASDEAGQEQKPHGTQIVGQAVADIAEETCHSAGNERALVIGVCPDAVPCRSERQSA